jgi:hypothetical protein
METKRYDTFPEALAAITDNYGEDILLDGQRLVGYVTDYLRGGNAERAVLKNAFAHNIPQRLADARDIHSAERSAVMAACVTILVESYAMAVNVVEEHLRTLAGALGWPEPEELADPNERGNTVGNTVNRGKAVIKGGWIYYVNNVDKGKLYKMRADGTDNQVFNDDRCTCLNIGGGWIYYSNLSDDGKLYRIRVNGKDKTKLIDDDCSYVNIVGGYAYYRNASDGGKPYRVCTNGTSRQKLTDDDSYYINAVGDWVYYVARDDSKIFHYGKICKVRTDGTDRQKLSEDASAFINVASEYIYYTNNDDERKLYKIRIDGTGRQKLSDETCCFINVDNDWIYYRGGKGWKLYKMRTDGTNAQFLEDEENMVHNMVYSNVDICINIVGDWVLFSNSIAGYRPNHVKNNVMIRTDGTGRRLVD